MAGVEERVLLNGKEGEGRCWRVGWRGERREWGSRLGVMERPR